MLIINLKKVYKKFWMSKCLKVTTFMLSINILDFLHVY